MKSKSFRQPRAAPAVSATQGNVNPTAPGLIDTGDTIKRWARRYQQTKRPLSVNFRRLLPEMNSTDRLTHLIHPYPAKLLVHIPFFFLANDLLSRPGDLVLDPFCGSGTVMLEAQVAGRRAYGADSNPLARLIANSKTTPLDVGSLERTLDRLLDRIPNEPSGEDPDVVNLRHWFFPHVVRQLQCLRQAIEGVQNAIARDFFLVCFSATLRKVSLADPRLSVPVRLRLGQYPKKHPFGEKSDAHLRKLRRVQVAEVFTRTTRANLARMLRLSPHSGGMPEAEIVCSDARRLVYEYSLNGHRNNSLDDESVQLIITSPPYPGAQKYIRSCSLSLGWLRLCKSNDLRSYKARTIGREEFTKEECDSVPKTGIPSADRVLTRIANKSRIRATIAATYLHEMRSAIREMCRVLKEGGHLILVAANNRIAGIDFRTVEYLRKIAEECGLSLTTCLIDAIRSRGLMTKRNHTASVITREWVLIFTKGGAPQWSH